MMGTVEELNAALTLAARGLLTFPCGQDKKPLIRAWEQAACTDPSVIRGWWATWPQAVPALPCGPNGLVVVDCDCKAGIDGEAEFRAGCAASSISLDTTFSVCTPSGGKHYFFRADGQDVRNSVGKLGPGIDVRAAGGYVAAYSASVPHPSALQPLPASVAAFLAVDRPLPGTTPVVVDLSRVTDGDRAYGMAALRAEYDKLAALTSGRNNALNVSANCLGEFIGSGMLDEEVVVMALRHASDRNLYTAKDGERERDATMFSGLSSGKARPRPLPSMQPTLMPVVKAVSPAAQRAVKLTRLDTVQPKAIDWLWDSWIPKGKLTIIAGEGGIGKSTIAYSLLATVSTGGTWPDGTRARAAGNVLIWSSEDDTEDTIVPRLLAMNADLSKIGVITGTTEANGDENTFDPARDVDELRRGIVAIGGVAAILIDPLVSAVAGDMHKANDVRRSLQPLVDLAVEMHCAVIGITHFAKNTSGKAVTERVIGSQAFTAQARATLVAKANDETGERVLIKPKMNNARNKGGYHYSIEERVIHPQNIRATAIKWGERVEGTAQEIVDSMEQKQASKASPKTDQAKDFLQSKLKDGPRKASALYREWEELGIGTAKTLQRASEQLRIAVKKEGFQGESVWSFPSFDIPWQPSVA